MRRRFTVKHMPHEFDLDLAPLLAVMVKLVPVLLVSSAFVQLAVIETELPQVVKAAAAQAQTLNPVSVSVHMNANKTFEVDTNHDQKNDHDVVVMKDNTWDYNALYNKLVSIKKTYPQVFKLDLSPNGKIPYQEIVHVMDVARASKNIQEQFEFTDPKTNKKYTTPLLFPEITFINSLGSNI